MAKLRGKYVAQILKLVEKISAKTFGSQRPK
jgi:hypothetical protein